ncbi:MAG: chemotaxis protein CheA [Proteobacteria bacterium]|nr:chemotaxis protein CheA [Pseudomonadota bacterium]
MTDIDKIDLAMFMEDYLFDAKEVFQEVNRSILALEKDYTGKDHLDNILRNFHTLKSSSSMLNFIDISDFAHRCEDFMSRLIKQEIPVDKDTVDFLFEANDAMEVIVKERAAKGAKIQLSDTNQKMVETIREKMAYLESKEMLSRLGIIVIDQNGIIEAFNTAAELIFLYPSSEVVGQNVRMLVPDTYQQNYDAYIEHYLKTDKALGLSAGRHVQGLRRDGTTFPMELAVSDVNLGEKNVLIGVIKDASVYEIKKKTISEIEKIQTVKIHVDLIDALFNLVGELIISRNRLNNLVANILTKDMKSVMISLNHIITELQEKVSSARMVPVEEIFLKFPKMVRDIALEKLKEVEMLVEGSDTELDKSVLNEIGQPLMHLLRNAVGHGIESPEVREQHNKVRRGLIKLSAKQTENHIVIEVEDDGSGIDAEAIKEIAIRKNHITLEEAGNMQEKDILSMLFKPGFSSASEITGLSGRGVGLDIVKTAAEKLGGTVEIFTRKGAGTRFSMKLPIAQAIMQTLMIGVGKHVFLLPSNAVLETMEVNKENIKRVGNREVFILRNEALPFIRLKKLLNIDTGEQDNTSVVVIIYRGDDFVAVGVDAVIDQMENIIKPFDTIAQTFRGFSGGTILPDGSVALLLDMARLFDLETLIHK